MTCVQGGMPALFVLAYTVCARWRAWLLLGSARKQELHYLHSAAFCIGYYYEISPVRVEYPHEYAEEFAETIERELDQSANGINRDSSGTTTSSPTSRPSATSKAVSFRS